MKSELILRYANSNSDLLEEPFENKFFQEVQKLMPKRRRTNTESLMPDFVEDSADEIGHKLWSSEDSRNFFPVADTFDELPPDVYEPRITNHGQPYFYRVNFSTEDLILFDDSNINKVVNEIFEFWKRKDRFEEFGFPYKRGLLLWGVPGCHAKGTKVVLYKGECLTKNVEDVQVGDILMGPDSKPRNVLALCRGFDEMYRITPVKGDPFLVNGHHILSLQKSGERNKNAPSVLNITVNEYIKLSRPFKQRYKLYRSSTIQFNNPNKNPLRTGIKSIELIGRKKYFGFVLDRDHLYMTDDFIVHHNSGKSCAIKLIIKQVIAQGGIGLRFDNPTIFIRCMRTFRLIQPNTPVVAIMEDLDAIMENHPESIILNMLDGIDSFDNIVYLATTNYPQELEGRIKNRPSRFDKRFHIGFPNAKSREIYIKHLQTKTDSKNIDIDIEQWVKDTKDFTFAHIKELFTSVALFEHPYDEALADLHEMRKKISSEDDNFSGIGFHG